MSTNASEVTSATRRAKASTKKVALKSQTKASLAQALFDKLHGKMPRKEVIERFVKGTGLTPSGANTYYQRFLASASQPSRVRGRKAASAAHRQRGRPIDESSKAGVARQIFKRMHGKKARKDIVQAFQDEAGLTAAGSSTYYQKIKNAA